jgi:uncharacterized membrane protein
MPSFNFGELHPAIIHFPIALIIIAFAFDLLYAFRKRFIFHLIAGWMIMIAAALLIPTALTGFLAKSFYSADDPDVIRHQTMALVTIIFTLGYAIFRGWAQFNHKIFSHYLFLFLSLINVGLISNTAEFGGIVVRAKGIMYDTLRPKGTPLPYGHVEK